jgi:uncharacterized membrane protein YfcA
MSEVTMTVVWVILCGIAATIAISWYIGGRILHRMDTNQAWIRAMFNDLPKH